MDYKGGYVGKILRVNLSENKITTEPLELETAQMFMGGRGLGSKIIFEEVAPKTDPLGVENKIVFATGPLTGSRAPSCCRFVVVTKSPVTNTITMANAGGFFGPELKFAGYDAIVIEGKAKKPSFIQIRDSEVKIRDASFLWGLCTNDTEDYLQERLGASDSKIACIGPAGEKLVKYASVISGKRAAGRGGVGAVMGSKNLKAVVVQGTGKINYADESTFKEAVKELHKKYKESPQLLKNFSKYGTPDIIGLINELGILPTKNFQFGKFDDIEKIDAIAQKAYVRKHLSCYICPVGCGKIKLIPSGTYAGMSSEGPEYESSVLLGSNCGIGDMDAIITADRLCDEFGMDTISTGNVIGFAMELYDRKIISKKDTDGIKLKFGNSDAMMQMIRKIAFREGFGDLLAEGVRYASKSIGNGAEDYALHVKGLELPGYDPRGAKAHGFGFAVSPRGACHNRGYAIQEIFGNKPPEEVDRFEVKGKGRLTKWNQDFRAIADSASMCAFVFDMASAFPKSPLPESVAKLWASATGFNVTEEDLWKVGERVNSLERAFNFREGFTRADDILPKRIMEEPMPDGPAKGQTVGKEDLDLMLDEYYKARGWYNNGKPKKSSLVKLGMKNIADAIKAT